MKDTNGGWRRNRKMIYLNRIWKLWSIKKVLN
nr:MAG TPA: hypothetical protein [Caudoviricetes sp.]